MVMILSTEEMVTTNFLVVVVIIFFQLNYGAGRAWISDYNSGVDMIGLLGGIREIDLSFQERNGHTRITEDSNDDLIAIEASTIASDLTFV